MSDHNPSREVDVFGHQLCGCGDRYPCPTVILTDLIAELTGDDGDAHAITDDGDDDCLVCQAIDRAEARLRGLNDE